MQIFLLSDNYHMIGYIPPSKRIEGHSPEFQNWFFMNRMKPINPLLIF